MSIKVGIIASSKGTAAPPVGLLLDTYTGAAAAYSLRKLRTAYTGAAIRVRRSSDNTETDIGFNGGNILDTSALTTFVSAGNGFVTIWYDQSGNGNNAAQSTSTNQPQIVNAGVINTQGIKPCLKFNGNNFLVNANNGILRLDQRTHFIVARELTSVAFSGIISYSPSSGNDFSNSSGGNLNSGDGSSFGNTTLNLITFAPVIAGAKPMPYRLISLYGDTTTGYLQSNNGTFISALHQYVSNSFQTGKIYLAVRFLGGVPNTTYGFNGIIQEIIMYNGSNQNSNISAINNNINSYYTIY